MIEDGLIKWSVTEKPTDFALDAERSLLEKLNVASLNAAKSGEQVFVKSDITQLKNADLSESVVSNTALKIKLRD
ncbi:hypothetical protein OH460_08565 [Vibrio sp. Makdt]|uniref:hypothetical protein n=1 Tax=Vibrio sp. Makdt TaxID=2998828 RepID=UPI0022CDAAA7|nr:hypothetical protein [Vibrio sp. Makdt]MDA0152353.1 hypothetical protein [Vibrio sp. Makdt]